MIIKELLKLNEASTSSRLRTLASKVMDMQQIFSKDSAMFKNLKDDGADMSYFDDVSKALDDLEEAMTELQKSVEMSNGAD